MKLAAFYEGASYITSSRCMIKKTRTRGPTEFVWNNEDSLQFKEQSALSV